MSLSQALNQFAQNLGRYQTLWKQRFQGVSLCLLTCSFSHFYSKSAYTTDMATRSGRRVKDFSESELSQ